MQNLPGWMACSISIKLRGLSAKNRTWLELVLNGTGLQVDSLRTEGLSSKFSKLKGYARI